MPVVLVRQETPLAAHAAYGKLARPEDYPKYTPSVLGVESQAEGTSDWTVRFRTGVLKWTERDIQLQEDLTINFEQITGDFDAFSGSWRVIPSGGGGSEVEFRAEFDLGMPSLAEMLNPVASDALAKNVEQIIAGLGVHTNDDAGTLRQLQV